MNIRPFEKTVDYEVAAKWWLDRKYYVTPLFMLPPNGYVIEKDGKPICIGFLLRTDAGVAGPAHLVSDPTASGPDRDEALDLLLDALISRAKQLGYQVVAAETNKPKLIERYLRRGFTITDQKISGMLMKL